MSAYMVNEDTLDLIASVAMWSNHGLFIYASEGTLPPRGELEYADEMTLARSLQNRLPVESYVSAR